MYSLHKLGPDIPEVFLKAAYALRRAGATSTEPRFRITGNNRLEYVRYTGAIRELSYDDIRAWAREYAPTPSMLEKTRRDFA